MSLGTYHAETNSIHVKVNIFFLEEESVPHGPHYVWAYHIQIENKGTKTIKLLKRYWRIVDSSGNVEEVNGEGVVGEQPVLKPGDSYEYTSGVPLKTPSGIMGGYYEMEAGKEKIKVLIPTFSLDSPFERVTLN